MALLTCLLCTSHVSAQATSDDPARHWTLSALVGVSSLALGGGGSGAVWSRVGRIHGGEGLLTAVDYGGARWSIEAAYGQGHASLAEFTASTLTLSLSLRRSLGFASTDRWKTRLGVGFVRSGVSVPTIPLVRLQVNSGSGTGEQLLLGNGVRTELSVVRRSTDRVQLNGRLGMDLSGMQGTAVPLVPDWGRMTSAYVRFGVEVRR